MANSNAPFGLRPIRANGMPFIGSMRLAFVPSSQAGNIFLGDPVVALGGGDAFGVPSVGIATAGAGNSVLGCMIGINNGPSGSAFTVTRDLPVFRQASLNNYILIADDPNQLYAVQEDSVGGAIAAGTGEFANGNLVAGAGSIVTGFSGWQLQSSGVSNSANPTFQLRILELLRGPGLSVGVNAVWVTRLNLAQLWQAGGV